MKGQGLGGFYYVLSHTCNSATSWEQYNRMRVKHFFRAGLKLCTLLCFSRYIYGIFVLLRKR